MRFIVRQGDILLIAIDMIPATAKPARARKRLIVAEGEATGHHHLLVGDRIVEHTLTDTDVERRFLQIVGGELQHDEHATIILPDGAYEVKRQREYAPDAIRTVAD